MTYDCIVIGAGPAGSAASITLAQRGWRVALVEASEFPRHKVCGEYLSWTNWQTLKRLGVWETFIANAGPAIKRVALLDQSESEPVTAPLPAPATNDQTNPGEWGRAYTRDQLDLVLVRRAAELGVDVHQPYRVKNVVRDGADWCVQATDSSKSSDTTLRSPVIIQATGRDAIGDAAEPLRRQRSGSGLLGFKTHFRGVDLEADLMPLLAFPGGYGGMVTCQEGLVSLSCCIKSDRFRKLERSGSKDPGDTLRQHLERTIPKVAKLLHGTEQQGRWRTTGSVRPGYRRMYHQGLFAVGSCAGEPDPVIAEGISMALQSGELAADCLAAHASPAKLDAAAIDRAGAAYATRWRQSFRTRIAASQLIAFWATRPRLVAASHPVVARFPKVLTLGSQLAGKGSRNRAVSV